MPLRKAKYFNYRIALQQRLNFIKVLVCGVFLFSFCFGSFSPNSLGKMPPQFNSNPQQGNSPQQHQEPPSYGPNTPRSVDRINVHSLGVGLGETFLMGDFANNGDDRISLDALYSYSASYSFDLLLDVHYSKHKKKQEQVTTQGIALGLKAKMYQFDNFAPFALGGLGFYRPVVTRNVNGEYKESDKKTSFGWHLGVGADLKLNMNYTVGILAHYHHPFDIDQDSGPKVSGSYFKLMMTFMYSF